LQRAKQGIAALDGFGLQPHFEEFWEDFAARYELVLGEPVRSNRTDPDDGVTAGLLARIRADNASDLELYDYAEGLYHQRRATR
jgi:hypothetical protein